MTALPLAEAPYATSSCTQETPSSTACPPRSSPRSPSAASASQENPSAIPSPAPPHASTSRTHCCRQRIGRTCDLASPVPCQAHQEECSTAKATEVHPAASPPSLPPQPHPP